MTTDSTPPPRSLPQSRTELQDACTSAGAVAELVTMHLMVTAWPRTGPAPLSLGCFGSCNIKPDKSLRAVRSTDHVNRGNAFPGIWDNDHTAPMCAWTEDQKASKLNAAVEQAHQEARAALGLTPKVVETLLAPEHLAALLPVGYYPAR